MAINVEETNPDEPQDPLGSFDLSRIQKAEPRDTDEDSALLSPRAVIRQAMDTNPEEEARIQSLTKQSGLPEVAVRADPDAARKEFDTSKILSREMSTTPSVKKLLDEYRTASLSFDDVESLTALEEVLRYPDLIPTEEPPKETTALGYLGDLAQAFGSGPTDYLGQGLSGLGRIVEVGGDYTARGLSAVLGENATSAINSVPIPDGADPASLLTSLGAGYRDSASAVRGDANTDDLGVQISSALGQVLGQGLLTLANPVAATTLMAGAGVENQAQRQIESGTYRDSPLTDAGLLAGGTVEAVTERMAIDWLLKLPPEIRNGLTRRVTDVLLAGGVEAAQETVAGIAQDAIEYASSNPDVEIGGQALNDALVGGGAGAIARAIFQVALPRQVGAMSQSLQRQVAEEEQASLLSDAVGARYAKLAQEAKLAQRSPEVFYQFVSEASEDTPDAFIDAAQLAMYIRGIPPSEREGDPALRLLSARLKMASDAKESEVSIPVEEYLSTIAATSHAQALQDLTVFNDKAVPRFRREYAKEQARGRLDALVAQAQQDASSYVEAQDVYNRVLDQLKASGVYSPAISSELARLVPAWAVARSQRTGESVEEVFRNSGLTIEGPETERTLSHQSDKLSQPYSFEMEETSPENFRAAVEAAKVDNKNAGALSDLPDNLSEYKTYLSLEGDRGFAISPEGRLTSLFKDPRSPVENAGDRLVFEAKLRGATSLDTFEGFTSELYARHGFETVETIAWDDQYAPDVWDYDRLGRPDVLEMELQGTGLDFNDFFGSTTEGSEGQPLDSAPAKPVTDLRKSGDEDLDQVAALFDSFRGHFDQHISKSIPGYEDVTISLAAALVEYLKPGTSVLDIGASEGSFGKTVSLLSGGQVETVSVDPNQRMRDTFYNKEQVEGASFSITAFPTHSNQRGLAWTESNGEDIYFYEDDRKFDVVLESMVFQFISRNRRAQIRALAGKVKEDGIAVVREKLITDSWAANEAKKNKYKAQYFSKEAISEKSARVLEGMTENMVSDSELVAELSANFKYVTQIWDSGNFKGYAASNNLDNLKRFSEAMPDTTSEYDTRSDRAKEAILLQPAMDQGDADPLKQVRGARGYYYPDQSLIRLTEASDVSTFIHEFAHFMYETELRDNADGLPNDIKQDTLGWHLKNAESLASEASGYYHREKDRFDQEVFHGSEAEFERLATEHVGSAENGSAHGWGVYLTNMSALARGYTGVTGGWMYRVEIPENDELAEQETVISEQPEKIRAALLRALEEFPVTSTESRFLVGGVAPEGLTPLENTFLYNAVRVGPGRALARAEQQVDDAVLSGDSPERVAVLRSRRDLLKSMIDSGATLSAKVIQVPKGPDRATMEELYDSVTAAMAERGETDYMKAASLYFKEAGVPGLSLSASLGGRDPDSLIYVLWDDAVMEVNSRERVDPFIAHMAQEELPGIPGGQVTEEMVRRYLLTGTSGSEVADASIRVATHEQFARAFELYMMEGKAPSVELRRAFRKFARWIVEAYRALMSAGPTSPISDDIRSVFDRLLATEKQIRESRKRDEFELLFKDQESSGMSPEGFKEYQETAKSAEDEVAETVRDQILKEVTRIAEQDIKQGIADIWEEKEAEVRSRRPYATLERLKRDMKLDRAAVKEMVGIPRVGKKGTEYIAIPTQLNGATLTGKEGIHPDLAAAVLGFSSGQEMLEAVLSVEKVSDVVAREAREQVIDDLGDPLNPQYLNELVESALAGDKMDKLILKELKALRRGDVPETPLAAMRSLAEDKIATMSYREIHPGKYRREEVRAAQEAGAALAAGNREGAAAAKERQLLFRVMGEAATKARARTEDIVSEVARYNSKNVREAILKSGGGHWEQIVKILSRFEFRKSATLKQVDVTNQSIQAWAADRVENHGDGLLISAEVMDEGYIRHWKQVPFGSLQSIYDTLRNIEHVARNTNKLDILDDRRDFDATVNAWVEHMDALDTVYTPSIRTVKETGKEKVPRWSMSQMTKIPWMATWLDNNERAGMSHDILMGGVNRAFDQKMKLWKAVGAPITEVLEGHVRAAGKRFQQLVYIPEIQDSIYGDQVVAVALNTGNMGNLKKMLLGEGWADPEKPEEISFNNPKLQGILRHMTREDWDFVQTVWNQMDTLYPQLAEIHRRNTGLEPPKVIPVPIQTPYGEYAGGYYPVKYDVYRSQRADDNKDKADASTETMFGNGQGSIQASVQTGATEERTGFYDTIRLHLDVIPNHFDEVIHYITHHEPVRQLNRVIRDPRVRRQIEAKLGRHEYRQLVPWLTSVANDGREAPAKMFWEAVLGRLRTGITLGYMGFKASTIIMQSLGLSNAAAEVGPANLVRALRQTLGSPQTMQDALMFAVESGSQTMQYRMDTFDREVKAVLHALEGKSGWFRSFQETGMKMIALMQTFVVDTPTWHAAYMKEIKLSGDEQKAVRYADWAVENIHGSGNIKDSAFIMRSQKESDRMFTMFMTFFSAMWNNQRDLVRGARSKQYSYTDVAARAAFLFVVPVIGDMILRGAFFPDEDEDETWGTTTEKTLLKVALYPAASVPFVRDVANGVGGDFGYSLSPVGQLLESGLDKLPRAIRAGVTDEEISRSTAKGSFVFLGALMGVPGTSQAWATSEHLYKVMAEGEELTLKELLYGPEWKR